MINKPGVAIDIGTTTVVMYVVCTQTGEKIGVKEELNAQRVHGSDITSRIMYCTENGHELLTRLIREQLDKMLHILVDDITARGTIINAQDIERVVIAANTTMQHIAAGLSPAGMGFAPYNPLTLFGEYLPAWDTLQVAENASIYYTPGISAFVGGDITAGLLAARFEDIDETALFVDIGTNGEIVLKHRGTYYCCAAAAGPAFEHLESTKLRGSELIDMLAQMLERGDIDSTGRLIRDTGDISAYDIRQLQLAKAAIAAGIRVLMRYAGINENDIKHLALAGAFGTNLNPDSAAHIGLFPKSLLPVTKAYGNTAGEGAVITLCTQDAATGMEEIRKKSEYIELSSNAFFNDMFTENIPMGTCQ